MRIEDRFNEKYVIDPLTQCWLWTASKMKTGYGCLRINKKTFTAHRVSYELHKGPIPQGMHVLHICDVRACVQPEHLVLGSNLDNIRDSMRKGRRVGITRYRPSGLVYDIKDGVAFKVAHMKLKPHSREIIREAYRKGGIRQRDLARLYNVSASCISRVCNEP